MFFIDTNIFLEWLLGRKSQLDCQKILNLAVEGKEILACSCFSVYSVCLFFEKSKSIEIVEKFLNFLKATENIKVISTTAEDNLEVLKIMKTAKLDFDDAIQCHIAKSLNCQAIITIDSDFKNYSDTMVLTPKDFVESFPRN